MYSSISKKLVVTTSIAVMAIAGCKKDGGAGPNPNPEPEPEPAQERPVISSVSPLYGAKGTQVTIKGLHFGASTSKDTVTFNGKKATIVAVNDSVLTVKVPAAADYGPIVVQVGKQQSKEQINFDFQWTVSTFVGNATTSGHQDGLGTNALFNAPRGICADQNGNLYVTELTGGYIRKITAAGQVTTLTGKGEQKTVDGAIDQAYFNSPIGITVDGAGSLYVAESGGSVIRKIANNTVTTIAGTANKTGRTDGAATTVALLNGPTDVKVAADGSLYIVDASNSTIRKLSTTGIVSTVAGTGNWGYSDGTGTAAAFYIPWGIAISPDNVLYVTDANNYRIRKITAAAEVSTLAGQATTGHDDGTGSAASFSRASGITINNNGILFVADYYGNTIRRITPAGVVSTIAGNANTGFGYKEGVGSSARFHYPYGITVGTQNELYVVDTYNNCIRKVD